VKCISFWKKHKYIKNINLLINKYQNMIILITGVAGLIGSKFGDWLIDNLEKKGITEYEIIGIDDLSGGYRENIHEKIKFYNINLTNFNDVEVLFKENPNIDLVYHFAAYAAEGLSPFIRKFNYNNNLLATTNLVNLSIKYCIRRLVFTSSMATYGNGRGDNPFTENTPQEPIDPYGVAKFACEMDIKIAGEQHGLEWCIIRPHNVFGDKQNIWDVYRNVLGIWMYQLLNNEDITIYGDGTQTRAFSYIDDILEPLWKAGIDERSKNECINLGGYREYSINEAADTLIDLVGYGRKLYLEKRHEVHNAVCSHEKSVKLLDYKMNTDLRDGLKTMWEWAKKQPKRERKEWNTYELEKGIYKYWQKIRN